MYCDTDHYKSVPEHHAPENEARNATKPLPCGFAHDHLERSKQYNEGSKYLANFKESVL